MKIKNILKKFTSRKFLAAVAGVAVGAALALGVDASDVTAVVGAVTAVVSAVTYIVTEGKVDAESVKVAVESIQNAADALTEEDDAG